MMPQESWPRISLDMGLHAKFLLFILFPGNFGQRDQAFPVFYVLFLLLLTSLFFFFFLSVFLFKVGRLPDTLFSKYGI